MKRQIVGLVVLFSVFACLLSTIIVNSKYIFRTEPYYSETQVEEMCDDAYIQSIKDNSDQALYNKMSELTVQNLELTNTNNSLISQNESLKNQVVTNEKTIKDLYSQIDFLENTNEENLILISDLQSKILNLEKNIKLLQYEISQNEILIEENNKMILQLENSIQTYDDFLNGIESDKEVFAIFVIEKEIINIQKLNMNGLAYLENQPTFDNNIVFNGWSVNGSIVDLSSYYLSCNTTFIADLSYTYKVDFIVDDVVCNSQTILENECVSLPEIPVKDGYIFVGWSLNKVDVVDSIENISVTKNINYYAIFEKASLTTISVVNTDVLGGTSCWSDGVNIYYSSKSSGCFIFNPLTNNFDPISFGGTPPINGSRVWTDGSNVYWSVNSDHYKLNKSTNTWEAIDWGIGTFSGDNIWTDGVNVYLSDASKQYKLNKSTNTWESISWFRDGTSDTINLGGSKIWTDGSNFYYSSGSYAQYKINTSTNTVEKFTWDGFGDIYGANIWTDGSYIYYSNNDVHYILNKSTNTWDVYTWNGSISFTGSYVWSYDGNYYYWLNSKLYIFS